MANLDSRLKRSTAVNFLLPFGYIFNDEPDTKVPRAEAMSLYRGLIPEDRPAFVGGENLNRIRRKRRGRGRGI